MITCNGNGSFDILVVGVDKRMTALKSIPKEDAAALKIFVNERPELMNYQSLYTFHCTGATKSIRISLSDLTTSRSIIRCMKIFALLAALCRRL